MKLIALLIGLLVERLATQLFHLRELRWLDGLIDFGFRRVRVLGTWPPLIAVVLLVAMLVLPVFLVMLSLDEALFGFPYLVIAVVVLFFSLGPRDIAEEVDEYTEALEAGESEAARQKARALLERDPSDDPDLRAREVPRAVCVQGNNRLFAVVFWFVLLGPLGAWLYRATDLVRRRAVFNAARDETGESGAALVVDAASSLHGWLAWIPARLTALGYAMAGNFDAALAAWRGSTSAQGDTVGGRSDHLLAVVGEGALGPPLPESEPAEERAGRGVAAAKRLVYRSLVIWAAVIAAMTLYGWTV